MQRGGAVAAVLSWSIHVTSSSPLLLMVCRWVPVKERSRSLALVYSGMFLGSILGLSLSPQVRVVILVVVI